MDWSNNTVVLAGRDMEPTAVAWRELLVDHGYDALEYDFLYVLPILANVIFIIYTMYYFARVTPQRSKGPIDPQKMVCSHTPSTLLFELSSLTFFPRAADALHSNRGP